MVLPVTLCAAAAAGILALWLMMRCGQVRLSKTILMGDGGDDMMVRRMRAHANFAENTPFFLVLIGLIELAGRGAPWLPFVAALFIIGRVLHAFGMDGGSLEKGRMIGTIITMLSHIGLAVVAVLIAMGVM
jgi:uncharacterized membrane protein YecN with MAPEG domain